MTTSVYIVIFGPFYRPTSSAKNRCGGTVGLSDRPASGRLGVFESQSRQTLVIKTGCDSSTAKRLKIGVNVTGSRR